MKHFSGNSLLSCYSKNFSSTNALFKAQKKSTFKRWWNITKSQETLISPFLIVRKEKMHKNRFTIRIIRLESNLTVFTCINRHALVLPNNHLHKHECFFYSPFSIESTWFLSILMVQIWYDYYHASIHNLIVKLCIFFFSSLFSLHLEGFCFCN